METATIAWLASVIAFAVPMAATPGPNNVMVAASGATWGLRPTVPHIFGVALGFAAMLVAVALGAGGVMQLVPWLHDALRWVGGAYMLWLAWRIASATPTPTPATGAPHGRGASRPLSFLGAVLFQWVNPKAWVVALAAVATYTTAGGAMLVVQAGALAAVFFAVTLPACTFWTLVGLGATRVLRTRGAVRAFNIVMAFLLVASLLPLLRSG